MARRHEEANVRINKGLLISTVVLAVIAGLQWWTEKETAPRTHRPWVVMKTVRELEVRKPTPPNVISARLLNTGQGPALKLRAWGDLIVVEMEGETTEGKKIRFDTSGEYASVEGEPGGRQFRILLKDIQFKAEPFEIGIIGAGESAEVDVRLYKPIAAEKWQKVRDSAAKMRTYGRVEYEDQFRRKHFTTYCAYYEPSENVWKLCDHYNSAT